MPDPKRYEIRIQGWLDPCWFEWFEGLAVSNHPSGEVTLSGCLPDQAALHGVLAKIRNLNLTLLSVELIEE